MRAETFEKLAKEYQEEQDRITFALKAIQQENRETIANLDAALEVISEIGERYRRQDPQRQREILRQVVDRVVVDHRGKVRKLVLKPPFVYLHELAGGNGGQRQSKRSSKREAGKQTSSLSETGCSFQVGLGDPNDTQDEPSKTVSSAVVDEFVQFLDLIRYPQRTALEYLLTNE